MLKPVTDCTPATPRGHGKLLPVAIVAAVLLIGEGFAQRWLDRTLNGPDKERTRLAKPLGTLPMQIGPWQAKEIPMDQRVIDIAGCDDHVYRQYLNAETGQMVALYIAYAARPAKMISHRPQVCFPAHGWQPAGTRKDRLTLLDNTSLDCLIHHFTRTDPEPQAVAVLNYYILQGRNITEWTEFWSTRWRMPNLMKDPNFYVIQVQVSTMMKSPTLAGPSEDTIKGFAGQITPLLAILLPDKQ